MAPFSGPDNFHAKEFFYLIMLIFLEGEAWKQFFYNFYYPRQQHQLFTFQKQMIINNIMIRFEGSSQHGETLSNYKLQVSAVFPLN